MSNANGLLDAWQKAAERVRGMGPAINSIVANTCMQEALRATADKVADGLPLYSNTVASFFGIKVFATTACPEDRFYTCANDRVALTLVRLLETYGAESEQVKGYLCAVAMVQQDARYEL